MRCALSIAGSDCSGGAGIQADMKTMIANGVYAMTAVTALTAQNTTGVSSIMEVSPQFLKEELIAVFEDIRPDAVKIGMTSSSELIRVIASILKDYKAENIVVDPVMVSTSGSRLVQEDAIATMKEELFGLADIVTPNIPEAVILSGIDISSAKDMEKAAETIGQEWNTSVLVKGGHSINDANDVLYNCEDKRISYFKGKRINNPNTHGTGCTLSSAIASNLAKGFSIYDSVDRAKSYISGALESDLDLGKGSGPLDHGFAINNYYTEAGSKRRIG